jgi:hypothetical protein
MRHGSTAPHEGRGMDAANSIEMEVRFPLLRAGFFAYEPNHFFSTWKVVARPARAMLVVSGIRFGQTATQF